MAVCIYTDKMQHEGPAQVYVYTLMYTFAVHLQVFIRGSMRKCIYMFLYGRYIQFMLSVCPLNTVSIL